MAKERELSTEIINDWQMLMSGILQGAQRQPTLFKVKVRPDKTIEINSASVICHFINFKYIEAIVSINEDDQVLKIRHFKSYADTINIILNFINKNL